MYFVFPIPAKYFVVIIGAISLCSSMSAGGGIANTTHLGGLVAGYLYLKGGRIHLLSELKYRYLKWRINRMRRKFDVYSGGRAETWIARHRRSTERDDVQRPRRSQSVSALGGSSATALNGSRAPLMAIASRPPSTGSPFHPSENRSTRTRSSRSGNSAPSGTRRSRPCASRSRGSARGRPQSSPSGTSRAKSGAPGMQTVSRYHRDDRRRFRQPDHLKLLLAGCCCWSATRSWTRLMRDEEHAEQHGEEAKPEARLSGEATAAPRALNLRCHQKLLRPSRRAIRRGSG